MINPFFLKLPKVMFLTEFSKETELIEHVCVCACVCVYRRKRRRRTKRRRRRRRRNNLSGELTDMILEAEMSLDKPPASWRPRESASMDQSFLKAWDPLGPCLKATHGVLTLKAGE
jgi:hypothetical protein